MQLAQSHATLPSRYGSADDPRHPDTGLPICAAKSKHENKYGDFVCLGPVVGGRKRCRMHGGKQQRGALSVHTTIGIFSKDLPTQLAARYEAAMNDPDLINLTAGLALLYARLGDLLGKINTGESKSHWDRLREAKKELVDAREIGDADGLAYWLNEVMSLIDKGASEAARWVEIYNALERVRRMSETEVKNRTRLNNYVTAEQQMLLILALASLVNQHVSDPDERAAVAEGLDKIIADRKHAQATA